MVTSRGWFWRALYGAAFVAGVPAVLVLWARATEDAVPIQPVHAPIPGAVVAAAGLALIISGWYALIVHGRGLPMNAFPPRRLVREGVYRWIRNPIYIGFGIMCAGTSIAAGSASGLWLVTPTACLAAAALVFGLERPGLVRRFGPGALHPPLLSVPAIGGGDAPPTPSQRAAVFVWILIPWTLTWLAAQALGRPPDAFGTELPFERRWPVWQWTEFLYVCAYLIVPLTVFTSVSQRSLRRFALSGGIAMIIVTICWLTIPVVAPWRAFTPTTFLGELQAFERSGSAGVAAFPAFHVLWVLLAARAWSDDASRLGQPWRRWLGWVWAWAIAASCLTTGMHTVIEVGAAVLLYPIVVEPARTWESIRARTEALANSWREWRLGHLRLINHAVFAGSAAAVGFGLIAMALPPERYGLVVWIAFCAIAGAGIWAQLLEGSSVLLRPFGWYGGVLGGVIGVVTGVGFGSGMLPALAALALAAPWIQILGRMRCLVQGCCHGGPAPEWLGIRYQHRRSRVTQIAGLGGRSIHATPLYSIAGNIIIGVILLRLRYLGAADVLLAGVYLILSGLARFVEEGYREEPQTPVIAGLHSYQWLAVVSLGVGMWITTLPPASATVGLAAPSWRVVWGALVAAAVTGVAMGVDFPESDRRFSRLAPAD